MINNICTCDYYGEHAKTLKFMKATHLFAFFPIVVVCFILDILKKLFGLNFYI